MKLIDIFNIRVEEYGILKEPTQVRANVTVVTKSGYFWWKKQTTHIREVFLHKHSMDWIFVDDGEFVPYGIQPLWRSWEAKQSGKG